MRSFVAGTRSFAFFSEYLVGDAEMSFFDGLLDGLKLLPLDERSLAYGLIVCTLESI